MHLLDLLFPRRCLSCGRIGSYLCSSCFRQVESIKYPLCPICAKEAIDGATHPKCRNSVTLDGLYAATFYKGPIKKAVHLLKYRSVTDLTNLLGQILWLNFPQTLSSFDFLVPVPLSKKREKERGYNQSLLLAKFLEKKLGVRVENNLLQRSRHTFPQAKLRGKERMKNLKNAFICLKGSLVKGKNIALIDDVATTRTTLLESAKVLKKAGAGTVWGIVLAHG